MQHKTRLELIFWIKFTLSAIALFFILIGSLWAYGEVFYPSYVSVMSSCNIRSAESFGYVTQGRFTSYANGTKKISIYTPSKYDDSWQGKNEYKKTSRYNEVMRHEQCHQLQSKQNRFYGCDNKFLKYLNEVECYIVQYF